MKYIYLFLFVLVSGCASQTTEPSHYLLRSAQDLQSRQLQPSTEYSVGRVEIAAYIDKPGLVLETANGQMHTARNHLWAEPVYEGIRRQLMINIAAAHGEDILPDSLARTPVVIDIHIDQLHGSNQGKARLVAYWWLRQGNDIVTAHQFAEEMDLAEDGYGALVNAEENLLTRLAGAIASSMTPPGS